MPATRRSQVALAILLVVAAWLRLANLADNPGWDGDEGYNWSIAANLAAGHARRFALNYTFVDHPPLFYLLGAAAGRLWTTDLLALRALSALCGVLTVAALHGLGARLGGARLGLVVALIYALEPEAVLQARWAYTYNLLALLVALTLWALLSAPRAGHPRDRRTRQGRGIGKVPWALLCGTLVGLALATDQEALPLIVPLGLILWAEGGPAALLVGGIAAAAPPLLYLGWLWLARPVSLLFDLRHTAGRLDQGSATDQVLSLPQRLAHLAGLDPLIVLGLIGLLGLPRALGHSRTALWLGILGLVALALKVRDPNPYIRAAIPLFPCAALGLGLLVIALLDAVRRSERLAKRLLATVAVLALIYDAAQVHGRFSTAISGSLPVSTGEARGLAGWINGRVAAADLVIAMPQIAWLFHCRSAELLESVAYTGQGTAFYPAGLGPGRFAYDPRLQAARFLVVDRFTRLWIVEHPAERALVERAERGWPRVWRRGEYTVYANPDRAG